VHEDRIADPWGARTPFAAGQAWPVRLDMHLEEGLEEGDVDRWAQAASVLHSNGDAMDIAVKDHRIVGVRGRAGDRVNHGRLDRRICLDGRPQLARPAREPAGAGERPPAEAVPPELRAIVSDALVYESPRALSAR
jgi:hypothetical protein